MYWLWFRNQTLNFDLSVKLDDDESQIDRISDLPDAIICHILSFLPTKEVVVVSFLSTRWRNVLHSTPNLQLFFTDHEMEPAQFINFVDGVLSNCLKMDSTMHTLGFSCSKITFDDSIIERWFNEVVRLSLRSLHMWNSLLQSSERLVKGIGSCSHLTTLTLVNCTVIVPDSFCLSNLKFLSFKHVFLGEITSAANLLRGCPVLEVLILDICRLFGRILEICAPSLKSLILKHCWLQGIAHPSVLVMNYEITLNTPALEELRYYDASAASRYTVKELNRIHTAYLEVKPSKKQREEESGIDFGLSVAELVKACSKTKYLYLSSQSLLVIRYSHGLLTAFTYLEKLELGLINLRTWGLLLHLLDRAPGLILLCFELGFQEAEWHADLDPALSMRVPDCFAKNFTTCSILNLIGAKPGFDVVAYFLKHAKYLQKMVINFSYELNEELWSRKNFASFFEVFKDVSATLHGQGYVDTYRTRYGYEDTDFFKITY